MSTKRKMYKYTINYLKEGRKLEIVGTGHEYPTENILRIKKDDVPVAELNTDHIGDWYCVAVEVEE
jgi:hypothetical protein